jgi:hypothetical protein
MRLCLRVPVPPVQYWHPVDICKSEAVSYEKTDGFDGCV